MFLQSKKSAPCYFRGNIGGVDIMNIEEMVKVLKEPIRSCVIEFVKDCYENKNVEVDENVIDLLNMIRQRYIKNTPI